MNCLFVHTPKFRNFYNPIGYFSLGDIPASGLFSLADHLDRRGYGARILHLGLEKSRDPDFDVVHYLRSQSPRVVGLSLHWHYQLPDTIALARAIRRGVPNAKIVAGGLTASHFAAELLRLVPEIDFVIRGEGEAPLAELLASLENDSGFEAVPNLSYRAGGEIRHNAIGFVADRAFLATADFARYDLLEHSQDYFRLANHVLRPLSLPGRAANRMFPSGRLGHVVTIGRGCPVECSYCSGSKSTTATTTGRENTTLRPIDSVLRELRSLKECGVNGIYFAFDPYPYASYYPRLFAAIRNAGLKFHAGFESFALPDERLLDAFVECFGAGTENEILLGVESGDETLRAANRGYPFTNDALWQSLEAMAQRNLVFNISYTLGLPGETTQTLQATQDMWRRVARRYSTQARQNATIIHLSPGSPAENKPADAKIAIQPATLASLLETHRHGMGRLMGAWGHFPMRHECLTLTGRDPTPAGVTEKILQRTKCRHFCPLSARGLRYPLNRLVCECLGLFWRVKGVRRSRVSAVPSGGSDVVYD
ncbi:MAG: radical SAM protein [Candidatus Lernaella stagnicola]|nr:radical SAM protein [Candidatus Lernaella stagnicola]